MKVLVVVDMQNDFISGPLGTQEAKAIVPKVAQKIRAFPGAVAVTYDSHGPDYLATQEGKNLPIPHCIEYTNGHLLAEPIYDVLEQRSQSNSVAESFFKPTFGSTELGDWLSHQNEKDPLEEIVLVGLCTDICVISNALLIKAFLPEVKITVDAACCAGVTPQSHRNALSAMQACQICIENWEG